MFQSLSAWFPPDTDSGLKDIWRGNGGKVDYSPSYAYFVFIKDPFIKRSFELITNDSDNEGISFIKVDWIERCISDGFMGSTADYVVDKSYVSNNKQLYEENLLKDKDQYKYDSYENKYHDIDDFNFTDDYLNNNNSSNKKFNYYDSHFSSSSNIHNLEEKFDVEALYKSKNIASLSEFRYSIHNDFENYENFSYQQYKVHHKFSTPTKSNLYNNNSLNNNNNKSSNGNSIKSSINNNNNNNDDDNNNNSNINTRKSSYSNRNIKELAKSNDDVFDDSFLDEPSLTSFVKNNTSYSKDRSYDQLKLTSPLRKTQSPPPLEPTNNKDVINID